MNPYCAGYQALKRASETFGDSRMSKIIFKRKLWVLMQFIRHRQILGTISAFTWRIEYQKQSLCRDYILFWSNPDTQDVQAVEEVTNVRYPKDSLHIEQEQIVSGFRLLTDTYQMHHHSKQCRLPGGKCRFWYPQDNSDETRIRRHNYLFACDSEELPLSLMISCYSHGFGIIAASQLFIRNSPSGMS
jgi:hypothetical protein